LKNDEYPNLAPWFNNRMAKVPEIDAIDKKFREVLKKNKVAGFE
jgi:hypothetical protein